jgi:hypothetical protein
LDVDDTVIALRRANVGSGPRRLNTISNYDDVPPGMTRNAHRSSPYALPFAIVSKFAVAIIGCALGLVLAPAASASPGDVSIVQSVGPYQLPVPQQQGSECDPNYEPCVPVDSDVDCASGSGNGPSYVNGPVTVVGDDIYELDRDGNGTGCES